MQECLDDVIRQEKWDRATLQMPPHLRQRLMQEMLADEPPPPSGDRANEASRRLGLPGGRVGISSYFFMLSWALAPV